MSSARYLKVAKKLGLAALALGSFAGAGNAQTVYQGKFTLPSGVYWGGAALPAGDYQFQSESQSAPYTYLFTATKRMSLFGLPRPTVGFSPAWRD